MVTNRISDELSGELGQRKLKIVFFEEKFVQRPVSYLDHSVVRSLFIRFYFQVLAQLRWP